MSLRAHSPCSEASQTHRIPRETRLRLVLGFVCRERAIPYGGNGAQPAAPSPWEPDAGGSPGTSTGVTAPVHRVASRDGFVLASASLGRPHEVHRLACLVQSACERVLFPMAAVAREVVRQSAWTPVGHARPGDY